MAPTHFGLARGWAVAADVHGLSARAFGKPIEALALGFEPVGKERQVAFAKLEKAALTGIGEERRDQLRAGPERVARVLAGIFAYAGRQWLSAFSLTSQNLISRKHPSPNPE